MNLFRENASESFDDRDAFSPEGRHILEYYSKRFIDTEHDTEPYDYAVASNDERRTNPVCGITEPRSGITAPDPGRETRG